MERELEALAPRPAEPPPPPPPPPWQALLEALGGRGQVLLVGELWEREQSRALLRDFARALFPSEPAGRGAEPTIAGVPAQGAPGRAATRAIRSPLVFVLCRAASLAAREPRRVVREMLRDVRGRRRAGAALVAVLVAEAEADDAGTHPAWAMRRLEALLRSVFGRQAGGPVLAAAYRPDRPASCLDVQAAACRALQAAGPLRPAEETLERRGLPALLACFAWGGWSREKEPDATSSGGPAQGHCRDSEEELALTAITPNGHCDYPSKDHQACREAMSTAMESRGEPR
ncbi:uncharacterized protein C2orf72 homolog [Suncus etruscus]|uniref:uncharacterized protein C2orf72 homolog n=1 Tax=Suncus etruscus TaxID=109475 RepID=UPI00210F44D3|nr:uncharacterized protein C2orf72 homolog [Suncus etruscus]